MTDKFYYALEALVRGHLDYSVWLEIDPYEETWRVFTQHSAHDTSVPVSVWHRMKVRVPVPNTVDGDRLTAYLHCPEAEALLQVIYRGFTCQQDSNYNWLGQYTDEAEAALVELEDDLRALPQVPVWEAGDFYQCLTGAGIAELTKITGDSDDETVRRAAEAEQENARHDGCVVIGLEKYLRELRDTMKGEHNDAD